MNRRPRNFGRPDQMRWRAAVAIALLIACAATAAHELEANRLALVLRDATHLTLSFQLDAARTLHSVLAPNQPLREFTMAHAAMPPPQFELALRRAQLQLQQATHLALPDGRDLPIVNWRWPDPARWQAVLQRHTMQAIVAPGEHAHEAPLDVLAETVAPAGLTRVAVQPPAALQPLLLVWYRPQQAWVNQRAPKAEVRF